MRGLKKKSKNRKIKRGAVAKTGRMHAMLKRDPRR